MVQIKITKTAKKDIEAIFKHIKKDSSQNAKMVANARGMAQFRFIKSKSM